MKAAFCFLTRGDLLQPRPWEAFFEAAPADQFSLYCHPKHPDQIRGGLLAGQVIAEHLATDHGHISLVEATLALFAAAFEDPSTDYFILQSESAVPIVPFSRVRDGLAGAGGRSLIHYRIPPLGSDPYRRLAATQNSHLFEPYFQHSQWIILHRRHVALLLDRAHLPWFARSFAPDEHYFLNVLAHLKGVGPDEILQRPTTYVNWVDSQTKIYTDTNTGEAVWRSTHPKTYEAVTATDIAQSAACWFFRKISAASDCSVVLDRVGQG